MQDIIFITVLTGLCVGAFAFNIWFAYSMIKIERESR